MAFESQQLNVSELKYRSQVGEMFSENIVEVKSEYRPGNKTIMQKIKDWFKNIGFKKQPISQIAVKDKIVADTTSLFKEFLNDAKFNEDQDPKFRTSEYKAHAFLAFVQNEMFTNANLKLHRPEDRTSLYGRIQSEVNQILDEQRASMPDQPDSTEMDDGGQSPLNEVADGEQVGRTTQSNTMDHSVQSEQSVVQEVIPQMQEAEPQEVEVATPDEVSQPKAVDATGYEKLEKKYKPSEQYAGISTELDRTRATMQDMLHSLKRSMVQNLDDGVKKSDNIGTESVMDDETIDKLTEELDDLKFHEELLMDTIEDYLGNGGDEKKFDEYYRLHGTKV